MKKARKRRVWPGQGREINMYLVFARGQALCVVRWPLGLFKNYSRKGLVTGRRDPMGRVGKGILCVPSPVHLR